MFVKSVLSTLMLAAVVAASPHGAPHRRHSGANSLHVEPGPEAIRNATLVKRGQTFSNVRLSMYSPATGNQVACGGFFQDSDYIVALNSAQFESTPGHMCGTSVSISYGGQTAQATIVDECPGCPYGGFDCTPALANLFGFGDSIVFGATWSVGGGAPPPSSAPPPPPPSSTTPPPPPPPTSTSTPPPPPPSTSTSKARSSSSVQSSSSASATPTPTPSPSSSASSSSAAPSSTSASSTASSSAPATSSAAPTPTPAGNLAKLDVNIVNMALLALAAETTQ